MSQRQPFTTLRSPAAVLPEDNIDTDQIIPARFLKYSRADGYGRFLFHDRRFRPDESIDQSFVLNRDGCRDARIIVAGANFGGGSSREGAVYALVDYGIRCVIAPSFGPIFYKNCFSNGLLPARVQATDMTALSALDGNCGAELTVDLEATAITLPDGRTIGFEIEPFFREMLLKGVDEIGLTLGMRDEIAAFEKAYLDKFWFLKGAA